jgi:hypothetical protein
MQAQTSIAPPALTPERILWRAQVSALIRVLGKRKAERFLRSMSDNLETVQTYADLEPLRVDRATVRERRDAVQQAVAAFRADLPALLAALPQ